MKYIFLISTLIFTSCTSSNIKDQDSHSKEVLSKSDNKDRSNLGPEPYSVEEYWQKNESWNKNFDKSK